MVVEFWRYQVLEMKCRNDKENEEYLKMLVQAKLKEFSNAIKTRVDDIQHDFASLEICRKDEVEKVIDEEMKIRTDLLMGTPSSDKEKGQ